MLTLALKLAGDMKTTDLALILIKPGKKNIRTGKSNHVNGVLEHKNMHRERSAAEPIFENFRKKKCCNVLKKSEVRSQLGWHYNIILCVQLSSTSYVCIIINLHLIYTTVS